MKVNRQWVGVGAILGLIVVLIGIGWLVRDRFAPVEVGTRAPDFVARDLEGNPVRLADLQGKVVLLNIWATWCPPCREEMPSMQRLHEHFAGTDFEIVAVSIDAPVGRVDPSGNPGGDIQAFIDEFGLTFTIWHDPEGGIQRTYRITGVPESFLIDRNGYIVTKTFAKEWDTPYDIALVERLLGS